MNDKIFCTEDGFAVKTLFLKSLAKDLSGDQIFDYFSTFGTLQRVRINTHATGSSGLVKFEEFEAAAMALKTKHHTINGRRIEVQIAKNCYRDESMLNDELRIELANATGTEFMDLNDDCLREIFARVTAMDLCSLLELSQTSKIVRLRTIANEIFRRKWKRYTTDQNQASNAVDEVERVLAKFGPLISDLSICGHTDAPRKIESIINFCSAKLKGLHLKNFKFREIETMAIRMLFGNLKRLQLYNCRFEGDVEDLFVSCKSLDNLVLSGDIRQGEAICQLTYANLTSFGCVYLFDTPNLENFFSRHKRLTSIQILSLEDHSALLPAIAEYCTELKELAIPTNCDDDIVEYETSIKSISTLVNLKKLTIRNDQNALKLIEELKCLHSLTELSLRRVRCVLGIVTALSQLENLEILRIRDCDEFTNFHPLARLSRLKVLHVMIDEVITFDLVYMVSRLADLESFHLKTRNSMNFFTVDEEMHSRIVDARLKSGSVKSTLEIVCNEYRTLLRF